MNFIHPKKLLHSKWTKIKVINKLKHFTVIKVSFNEKQQVIECSMRAEFTGQEFAIDWRDLKNANEWQMGWL